MAIRVNCPRCRIRHVLDQRPPDSGIVCSNCGKSFRIGKKRPGSGGSSSQTDHPLADSTAQSLGKGSLFVGRYTIFRCLGGGGFGTVYLAHDDFETRDVAIKIPHSYVINDPKNGPHFIDRFGHEVQAIQGLQHPSIVRFFDAELDTPPIYLVTEFIDGQNLRQWLEAQRLGGGSIDRGQVIRWVIALASALEHAHGRGVIHRDVKPENIMLRGDKVVLTDFGLARVVDSNLTEAPDRLGTRKYMAPEQMGGENQNVKGWSDQYSLALVLHELLVGEVPFADEPLRKQIEESSPLSGPGISAQLAKVCQRAMARVPAQRYPSCKAFAEALRGTLPESEAAVSDPEVPSYGSASPMPHRDGSGVVVPPVEPEPSVSQVYLVALWDFFKVLPQGIYTLLDVSLVRQTRRMLSAFFQVKMRDLEVTVAQQAEKYERMSRIERGEPEPVEESTESGLEAPGLPSSFDRPSSDLARSIGGGTTVSRVGSTSTATSQVSSVTRTPGSRELEITALALTPDGLRVATGGLRTIRISGVEGGRSAIELPLQGQRVQWLAFTPDGQTLAVVIGRSVQVWDVADGDEARSRNTRLYDVPAERAVFAPDGVYLASAIGDGSVRLRDALSGFDVQTLTANPGRRPIIQARSLVFHPDRRRLAAGYADGSVVIWDWTTGIEVRRLSQAHDHTVTDVAFNREGTLLVTSSTAEPALKFWDAETLHRLNAVPAHPAGVLAMAFHPRRSLVVSASSDGSLLVSNARYKPDEPVTGSQVGKKRVELPLGIATGSVLSFDGEGKLGYVLAATGQFKSVDLSNI